MIREIDQFVQRPSGVRATMTPQVFEIAAAIIRVYLWDRKAIQGRVGAEQNVLLARRRIRRDPLRWNRRFSVHRRQVLDQVVRASRRAKGPAKVQRGPTDAGDHWTAHPVRRASGTRPRAPSMLSNSGAGRPCLRRPTRDCGSLQHSADGTVDTLNVSKRFQHFQIHAEITDPGHQRFTTFKLDAFAPGTPVHLLAVGDSMSNWSKIRVTM